MRNDRRKVEEEVHSQASARGEHRRDRVPAISHGAGNGNHNGYGRLRDLRLDDLRRILERIKKGKNTPISSVHSIPIHGGDQDRSTPVYDPHNPDLTYNGETDPAEYLIRFNIEIEVYQVSTLARCRLFAVSFRGSAQQWFS